MGLVFDPLRFWNDRKRLCVEELIEVEEPKSAEVVDVRFSGLKHWLIRMPKMFFGAADTFSCSEIHSVFTAPAVKCSFLFPHGCMKIEEGRWNL